VVYKQRDELMESDDISGIIKVIREDVINEVITKYIPPKTMEEQWDIALIFLFWVFLRIASKMNPLAQAIHGSQMFFPAIIQNLEHH
jgi:preprotein translocase subunit SecA